MYFSRSCAVYNNYISIIMPPSPFVLVQASKMVRLGLGFGSAAALQLICSAVTHESMAVGMFCWPSLLFPQFKGHEDDVLKGAQPNLFVSYRLPAVDLRGAGYTTCP